jgi:hypothetical protein
MSQGLSIAAAPIHPQQVAVGTANTGGVDMTRFRRLMFILDVGVFGASASVDMKLQVSPDNATWSDLGGTGSAISTLAAAGGNNVVATLEMRDEQMPAGKRYARALVTVGTAATFLCTIALGGEAVDKPGSNYDNAVVQQRQVSQA